MNKPKKNKLPVGKERMKRRPPANLALQPRRFEFDVKKACTPEQLSQIGAIALVWNQVEIQLEAVMQTVFFSYEFPLFIGLEMTANIPSVDRRMSVLDTVLGQSELFTDEVCKAIRQTFSGIKDMKWYRNAIVHCTVYDHEKGIAHFSNDNSGMWQVLITNEALEGIYERLVSLRTELIEVASLYRHVCDERIRFINEDGSLKADQKAARKAQIPRDVKRLLTLQSLRLGLKALPEFPDADLILLDSDIR